MPTIKGDTPMLKAQREFVQMARKHLKEHEYRLVWGKGEYVNCDGYRASGYFDQESKQIRVARKNKLWFEVFIHEYCHFHQWIDKSSVYNRSNNSSTIIDNWFNGKTYNDITIDKAFETVREMERDCEMRSTKLIKKYNLPVDLERYIRMANCYIYVHYFMREYRKFWPFESDLRNAKLLSQMPPNFRFQAHRKIPQTVYDALANRI
jgi:hypothetical protein